MEKNMETIITGIIWVLLQGSLLWYQQMSGWALYMGSKNKVPLVGFRAVLPPSQEVQPIMCKGMLPRGN